MVAFPDSIKTWVDKSDLVDFMTAAILNDDIMDEIIAVETAAIGHTRGGPLDLYMTTDPGFDQEINSGATQMTYNATNDRYECVCNDDDEDVHGVYRVLPSPLQITPDPSAIVELQIEVDINLANMGGDEWYFMAGFRDFTTPVTANSKALAMALHFDGSSGCELSSFIAGSSANSLDELGQISQGDRVRFYLGWQTQRPLTLTSVAYNAVTGAVFAVESHQAVTTSGAKDAALPHFGLWYWLAGGADEAEIYIYDMFARVLRV